MTDQNGFLLLATPAVILHHITVINNAYKHIVITMIVGVKCAADASVDLFDGSNWRFFRPQRKVSSGLPAVTLTLLLT